MSASPALLDLHTHHPGASPEGSVQILSLRPSEPLLEPERWHSRGLHPWYAEDLTREALERLERQLCDPHCIALGEAGLDRLTNSDLALQIEYFEHQIELSEQIHLPLIIHCVKAWDLLLSLHKRMRPRSSWIVHGFRSGAILAAQLLAKGLVLSFGPRHQLESLRLAFTAGAALLETDEASASILEVYIQASSELEIPLERLREQIWTTGLRYCPRIGAIPYPKEET
ncbi:TatD family hydrolase [Porphyromonas sp. COT-239 OH1446]|uniref:TatD family hydrolase n=1 Tax=Porphyromonas sp. COT-239 OH1446 TaxID=1515613 RepID=UPI00068D8FB7|nr:TatD family hydrolase [Porphyromonas sp. COT-239 OH1446]